VIPVTADEAGNGLNNASGTFPVLKRGSVTTSPNDIAIAEICAQVKKSGYAQSQMVRIYGEEFEILSDPFPNDIGVAIQVRSRSTFQVRALQLPATLIHRTTYGFRRVA